MGENQRKVRSIVRILYVSRLHNKTENGRLLRIRLVSSVNKPTSVGIELVSSIRSITFYKAESQRNKVNRIGRIIFVSKHYSKTENICLHN